jgi:hypothetical protein
MRKGSLAILAMLALALAGCGDSATSTGSEMGLSPRAASFYIKVPYRTRSETELNWSGHGLHGPPPKPVIPDRPPPETLYARDLLRGAGVPVAPGREVTVQYVGVDYGTGKTFDSSWRRGGPVTFTYGEGEAILGWEMGLRSMNTGGRRELVLPPRLTTGALVPGNVPPNRAVVYVIDLLRVQG